MKTYLTELTSGCWFLWVAIIVSIGLDLIVNNSVLVGINAHTFQVAGVIALYAAFRTSQLNEH